MREVSVIVWVAQGSSVLVGLWLIGLGVSMLVRPRLALAALARMGGSPGIHIGEMILRILAGAALMIASASTHHPNVVSIAGLFLALSGCVILAFPRRWHAAYSVWWSRRIPVEVVRGIAPVSMAMGSLLIWIFARP